MTDSTIPEAGPRPTQQLLAMLGLRFAVWGRALTALLGGAFELGAVPVEMLGRTACAVGAVAVWSVAVGVVAHHRPSRSLLGMDVIVVSAAAVTQPWTMPESAIINPGTGWAILLASFSAVAYQWVTPVPVGAVAGVIVSGAATVGTMAGLVSHGESVSIDPVLGSAWILGEVVLSRLLWRILCQGGERADAMVDELEAARRSAEILSAQRADERRHAAVLHDTAASTLLMVGLGSVPAHAPWLPVQARRDLTALHQQDVDPHAQHDLAVTMWAVIGEYPFPVTVTRMDTITVPADVEQALRGAVREAMSNIARHAHAATTTIAVTRNDKGVVVEIDDDGVGFDTTVLRGTARGLAHSIVQRMTAIGGTALVTSTPGRGTTVRLEWCGA